MAPASPKRCPWCESAPEYIAYHDEEWGKPIYSDGLTFEFLILETFQAGLSWLLILRRREAFRRAFYDFDPVKMAAMTEADVNRLAADASIVRNRAKINAAIVNAQAVLRMKEEEQMGLAEYFWRWVGFVPVDSKLDKMSECPASTPLAESISKDLKRRGFRFVGATVIYAHLQAVGIVNDHLRDCWRYDEVKKMAWGREEWKKRGVDVGDWGDGSRFVEQMEKAAMEEKGKGKGGKGRKREKGGEERKRKAKKVNEGEGNGVRRSRRLKERGTS